jgi:scyllo-inositol 2-dehydrogenase (NAD+)
MARLNVGLIGLGRLGRVYARDLSSRIAVTKLAAVADIDDGLAKRIAAEFAVPKAYADPSELIADPAVDAVVIVSPTHTHREIAVAALKARKPTFCEKPPSIHLAGAQEIAAAVRTTGTLCQLGFMRRFDPGYAAAKQQIDEGRIGRPVLFKATSRDPFPPSVAYADPRSSGGIFVDMGIHDFDLARWFMGDVATIQAVGGVLAFPELGAVGDKDNVIATMTFADGRLGMVDLTRNGCYGYDITTELLGPEGTIRIGYLRETPLLVMTRNSVAHDTVPYFMERFERAYTLQLENFAANVLHQRPAPVTIDDGVEALRVAVAATRACESGRQVSVSSVVAEGVA